MNKRWLVLLAPLGVAVGGVAGASSLPPAPAPTPVPEGLSEGQETVSAQECFDGFMSSCDQLFFSSPPGTSGEEYRRTCGGRSPDGQGMACASTFANAPMAAPASPTGDAPAPPAEETALAQTQFDAAMAANAIDPAAVKLVGCRADYSTAPNSGEGVVSSICLGFVGGEPGNPNNPPQLWGVSTIHTADGSVISFVARYPGMATGVGEPIPGTATPPISVPG
jgi:hypothetical protein